MWEKPALIGIILLCLCIGPQIHVFFCPRDACETVLLESINSAKKSVNCAIYSFTLDSVGDALLRAQQRGVQVRVVFEKQQSNVRGSEFTRLKQAGIAVLDNNTALMHHKFCVIDKEVVVTGSYNWSEQATERNNENLMIIRDRKLASSYLEEFESLLNTN